MQPTNPYTIDGAWEAAVDRLPDFSLTEQHVGLVLLAALARGEPVSPARPGRALGVEEDEAYLHDSALAERVPATQ